MFVGQEGLTVPPDGMGRVFQLHWEGSFPRHGEAIHALPASQNTFGYDQKALLMAPTSGISHGFSYPQSLGSPADTVQPY